MQTCHCFYILLRDHSDHHKDIVYLESIPGPDAGHSEDVAGQLKSRSVGGGVTGAQSSELTWEAAPWEREARRMKTTETIRWRMNSETVRLSGSWRTTKVYVGQLA